MVVMDTGQMTGRWDKKECLLWNFAKTFPCSLEETQKTGSLPFSEPGWVQPRLEVLHHLLSVWGANVRT